MDHKEIIKILQERAERWQYLYWSQRIDNKKVLEDYYNLEKE